MTPLEFFHAIEILLVVGVLVWFYARPWQALCIDISRQRYFELRDRLFLLAVNGEVSFEDPIYRELREWLNNRIRLAHKNVLRDLIAMIIVHKGDVPKIQTLGDKIEKVGKESMRVEMQSIYNQAIHIQIAHMIVRSPVILPLTALTPFVFIYELISGGFRACARWLTDLVQIADAGNNKNYIVTNG